MLPNVKLTPSMVWPFKLSIIITAFPALNLIVKSAIALFTQHGFYP